MLIFAAMFLKQIIKKDKQGNKNYVYYRLCESYRIDNSVRHRTLCSLGTLEDLTQLQFYFFNNDSIMLNYS